MSTRRLLWASISLLGLIAGCQPVKPPGHRKASLNPTGNPPLRGRGDRPIEAL